MARRETGFQRKSGLRSARTKTRGVRSCARLGALEKEQTPSGAAGLLKNEPLADRPAERRSGARHFATRQGSLGLVLVSPAFLPDQPAEREQSNAKKGGNESAQERSTH